MGSILYYQSCSYEITSVGNYRAIFQINNFHYGICKNPVTNWGLLCIIIK